MMARWRPRRAASLPFAPELVTDTLRELVRASQTCVANTACAASLNPTFDDGSAAEYGLDQGPIVMMIENHGPGLLWNLKRRCPYIWRGCGRRDSPADGSNPNVSRMPHAVEGRWRERGTHSASYPKRDAGRKTEAHATASMRAARIHSIR